MPLNHTGVYQGFATNAEKAITCTPTLGPQLEEKYNSPVELDRKHHVGINQAHCGCDYGPAREHLHQTSSAATVT